MRHVFLYVGCDTFCPLQTWPSQNMGVEQLLWWWGYVCEETYWGKGLELVPESPELKLALLLTNSVVLWWMSTWNFRFLHTWDNGTGSEDCDVESVYRGRTQYIVWLVSLWLHEYRVGPIQQYFPAESAPHSEILPQHLVLSNYGLSWREDN